MRPFAHLLVGLVLLPAAAFAQAEGPVRLDLTWSVDGPLANVRVAPARPTDVRVDQRGREAVLRFARPIAPPDADVLRKELPRFVDGVSAGFDTLLVVAAPGTALVARREGAGVLLAIRLGETATPAAEGDDDAIVTERAERRLERLRAALEAQTGEAGVARGRLAALEAKDSADAETLAQLAGLEQQIGRRRRAEALYARAVAADPGNGELAAARAGLARETAAFARAEPEYRRTSAGEKRYQLGMTAEAPVNAAWRLTAAFDQGYVDSPSVRRPWGAVDRFVGMRQRGALGLAHESEAGTRTHAQLFANARTPGVGLTQDYVFDASRVSVGFELARPYWDFTESLVADGTRDRAFVQYAQPWMFGLSARVRAGANRYGMPGLSDAARSATADGELRLPLDGFVRGASIAYVFEGEYPWRIASRDDPTNAGATFRPVPLRYREIHGILAGYSLDWRRDFGSSLPLVADLSAGPAYDRYGGRGGPLLGAGISWIDDGAFSGGFNTGYGRGVGRDASEYTVIGGFARWRM
jgi:hypothetical protein